MKRPDMPLTMASCGEAVTVRCVRGGHGRCGRLASLGILPGCQLKVVSKSDGPLIVMLKGSRLAIGYTLATSIMV